MNAGTNDMGLFLFEGSRRGSLRKLILGALIIAGVILYVGEKVKIVSLGYRIEALQREKQGLERSNGSLRIEAASLSSAGRIEEIAIKRLGMIRPAKENVVVVRKKGRDEGK